MTETKILNKGRQVEFDFAKLFAIFFMVLIHVYETVNDSNKESLTNNPFEIFVEFVGGPLAAPVFMVAMGVGLVYTRHNSPRDFAKRGLQIFGLGYLLNFFRGVFPILLGNLAISLFGLPLAVDTSDYSLLANLMTVDILPFAGLSFLLMALFKKWKMSSLTMLVAAILMMSCGMFIGTFSSSNEIITYLLGLFVYANNYTSFPLLLWFIYPVLGMVFAEKLQRAADKNLFYKQVAGLGLVGLIATTSLSFHLKINVVDFFMSSSYYQQNLVSSFWIFSIVLIALAGFYQLSKCLTNKKIVDGVKFIGSNLNQIYIIHWLIIPYIVGFVANLTPTATIMTSLAVMISSIGIRYIYIKIGKKV